MRSKPMILVALLLAAFLVNLDTTLVNVALPALVRELHATTTQLQWVVDSFNLVFAALLLTFGSLSDRFGRKGMLLAGLAVFGTASLAGGFTTSPAQLIAARSVMGLGAAMTFPATLSLISNVFTRAKGTGSRHRPVGRDRRRGHRDGADRRRLAAGALQLGVHLHRHGAGRGGRRDRRGGSRSRVEGPGRGGSGHPRPGAVVGNHGAAGLHHHRGAGLRLGGRAQPGRLCRLGGPARRVHRARAARRAPDARCAAVPQHAVQRGQRRGHRVVFHPVRLHLPDHPVLPVRPRLRPALGWCAPAAGGAGGRRRVGRRDSARGAGRDQAHRHHRPGRDGRVLRLGRGDHHRDGQLRHHRGPDGAVRARHGPDLGARHRIHHGRHLAAPRPASARR